jgi:DNA-binding LytR/AlgR family response regulator
MKQLNVAILEDNEDLRYNLHSDIEDNNIATIIESHTKANQFIERVRANKDKIDLLILDIELEGQNTDGIEVASILKKPVLFISGKSVHHLSQIEDINLDSDFPVESIIKPATVDKLKKVFKKIIDEIEWQNHQMKSKIVKIKIDDIIREIDQSKIVYIETITNNSNNKKIYFIDEKPTTLFNFTFAKMVEKGFNQHLFIKTHNSYRVNLNLINEYDLVKKKIFVNCKDEKLESVKKDIPISDGFYSEVRKILKSK